jgi:tetratricopeptide (TPR) repeat protein
MKDIATQLGVTKILEGGVQRAGDRVRITVQLIDAGTDAHLWAETYDRELTAVDIFAIQSEVAVAIADALKAELTQGEKARVDAVPTRNLEAWEAYQLGRQRLARRTTGALVEAEKFFAKAIELDPRFALAYTGLADSLTLRTDTGDTPYVAALEQAQVAVNAALKLDPALSEAWASAGLIAAQQSRTDRAEQMYRRAIELNPNNATALKWYGQTLVNTLRIDEGLRALEKAADLDPLSVIIQWNLSDALQAQGRFAEAATHDRRAIEIDPSTPGPYAHLAGLTGYALNRFAVAVPLAQKAVELDSGTAIWAALLSGLHLDIGDDDELLAKSKQTAGGLPDNWRMQLHLAFVDLYRQDPTGAVRNAEQSLARFPRNQGALSMLRNADLQSGHEVDAFARYQKAYPELFAPSVPRLDASNYGVAVDLALVLQKRGDAARASILLDAAAQAIAKVPRMGGEYGYGITDVQIHALRSDKAKALTALREAEKAGWRGPYWRYFRDFDPNLASIRDEPEFKAVFADIERDMARQRAELAKRPKDAPLALE